MSSGQITLLDFASKPPGSAWSRHSLKTRLLLNYKGLDYKTEWTEYPDIKPTVQPHVSPNEKGVDYTLPAVRLSDDTWIMDSYKIAAAIDKLHPSPALDLNSPYQARVEQIGAKITSSIVPLIYSRVPVNILNQASVEYWYTTRRQRLGMTVQEYEEKNGGEGAYAGAEPYIKQMTELLKEKEGPFFMGSQVTCADFEWVALLVFFKRVDEAIYAEVLERSGDEAVHKSLLNACASWLERNDY